MNKKGIISLVVIVLICTFSLVVFLILGGHDKGEYKLEGVGINRYFEYDSKEVLENIYTFTGKEEVLYKYYYQEDKEEELIKSIETYGNWRKIENLDDTDFYYSRGIERINKGYLFFYNFDYHNEVYDSYDYYHNIELGGTVSQFYLICAIDTENNIIWYLETERIEKRF